MAQQKKSQRHRGAIKAHRQSVPRNLRHRATRKAVRLAAKAAVAAAQSKDAKLADELAKASSIIDRAVGRGAMHWRTAARKKSRLALRVAQQSAPAPKAPAAK